MGGPTASAEPLSSLPKARSEMLEPPQPSSAREGSAAHGHAWIRTMNLSFHDILSAAVAEYEHLQDYASKLSKENFVLRQKLTLARASSRSRSANTKPPKSLSPKHCDDSTVRGRANADNIFQVKTSPQELEGDHKAGSSTSPPPKKLSNLMASMTAVDVLDHALDCSTMMTMSGACTGVSGVAALTFPIPANGDMEGSLSPHEPEGGLEGYSTPTKSTSQAMSPVQSPSTPHRWEVRADQGWMPFAPGVYFRGFPGEEVDYQLGSVEYKAMFHSEASGVQINMSTLKQRALRRYVDIDMQDSPDSGSLDRLLDTVGSESSQSEAIVSVMQKSPRPASKNVSRSKIFTANAGPLSYSQVKCGGSSSSSAVVNEFGESTTDEQNKTDVSSDRSGLSNSTSRRCIQSARSAAEDQNTQIEEGHRPRHKSSWREAMKREATWSEATGELAITTRSTSRGQNPAPVGPVHSTLGHGPGHGTPATCNMPNAVIGVTAEMKHPPCDGGLEGGTGPHIDVRGFLPRALAAAISPVSESGRSNTRNHKADDSWTDWDDALADFPEACDWNLNMPGHMLSSAKGITTDRSSGYSVATPRPPEKPVVLTPQSPRFLPSPRDPWDVDAPVEELNAAVSVS